MQESLDPHHLDPGGRRRPTVERWRHLALYVFLVGVAGTSAELVFLEHFEDAWQWAPMALLASGAAVALWIRVRPGPVGVRAFRGIAAAYLAAAALGIYLHLKANIEFELELRPTTPRSELLVVTLRGAIPALAPGTMAYLGLIALLICFRHPTLRAENSATRKPEER
jgi:hypothetical protein